MQGLKLVLVGKAAGRLASHPDVIEVGFVEDQVKWDAIAACELLVMPSHLESLSMVILEAWMVHKPVLVNAKSPVLVGQCRRSRGGVWYKNFKEFKKGIQKLGDAGTSRTMGASGCAYTMQTYAWPAIEKLYLEAVADLAPGELRQQTTIAEEP